MKTVNSIKKPLNSKGATIFKKMLDDQKSVREHLKNGGKLTDFKRTKSLS